MQNYNRILFKLIGGDFKVKLLFLSEMDRGGNMYKHEDKIQNRLEKSGISHILTEARATLNNPKRPETPELPRF